MRSYFFFMLAFLGILSATGTHAVAHDHSLPFMTVEEYTQNNPEQNALMTAFEARVKGPGIPCPGTPSRPVKVAFVYPGLQVSDYWRRSVASFRKRMDEKRIPCVINEYYSKPAIDQKLQMNHVQQALANDPDYLVFTMDIFKHKTIIESILSKSRPKLILQNITTPMREWQGNQPFMYIGFDHAIGSRLIADYYRTKLNNKGRYGLLYFTHGYVSTMRGDTFRAYMQKTSGITMADSAYTDGKLDQAYVAATAMLENHDLDFIYASSTDIAMGAIQALENQGTDHDVLVN